jgi:protein-S-isoprenylcysteine O-methyltransferase Ste14
MMRILKTLFFVIIGPGSIVVYIPCFLISYFGLIEFSKIETVQLSGIILFLVGVAIALWCFYNFIFSGKGTPVPIDPPKNLVVCGLYRYMRNPMYLGILLILAGEALFFESYVMCIYAACLFCLFQAFIIGFEEPSLKAKFGKEYEEYCQSVPRWLFRSR